jgi:NADPH:quinone reductase-like Zn-dependent oxidoreductase
MRAMVYSAPLTLEMQDVAEPSPATGEVVVEVRAAGICGSELEGFATQSPFQVPPLIMGHEFAGTVADTGRRVVVNPLVNCRECDLCLLGATNVCRRRALIGVHRPGGFGERVAVPERNRRWERLMARALTARTETADGLRLSFRPEAEGELRALVAVEAGCCAWAAWTIEPAAGAVVLDVRSAAEGIATVRAMFR